MNEALRDQLLAMAAEDAATRTRLAADGSLFRGYHPEMQAVHDRNAVALEAIIAASGWPGIALVGEDGAAAAWRIAQHAIARPDFQRACRKRLEEAAARGDAAPACAAYLTDRILVLEGRPQRYGTQFDWQPDGTMGPEPVDDREAVDARREALGLPSLARATAAVQDAVADSNEQPPADWAARRRELDAWARKVGWRD